MGNLMNPLGSTKCHNTIPVVYTGADGSLFQLDEGDGVSEKFRTKDESRVTELRFTQQDLAVEIGASKGTFAGAPSSRSYQVIYHGLSATVALYINGTAISSYTSQASIPAGKDGTVWDAAKNLLNAYVASRPVDGTLRISTSSSVTATGGTTGVGEPRGAEAWRAGRRRQW